MRYTVKDKSVYSVVIFSVTLIFYVAYIYYDHNNQNNLWRKDFGLKKKEDIARVLPNALLLGGSNVMYSLSATQLSESTKFSWFNLGLPSEAFNDDNYWNFVSSTLNDKQRLDVKLVVYSGIAFTRVGYLSSRENNNTDTWGSRKLTYLPNTSLAQRLRTFLKGKSEILNPLPTIRGDFDFDKKHCIQNYQEAFEREHNWDQVQTWTSLQISMISEKFPNADVVIVLPSEFYGKTYFRNLDISYQQKLRSFIQSKFGTNVSFLAQPQYTEKSITCYARHHANSVGRAWRTKNLIDFLNSSS